MQGNYVRPDPFCAINIIKIAQKITGKTIKSNATNINKHSKKSKI